ncbi:MAG TPA: hypothetical protein VG873_01735 [Burkholderiales bacterium]|nr:hypothetical protein [Burkholderiales bacterium]
MTRDERPLSAVPAWLWSALALALAVQVLWQATGPRGPASGSVAVPAAPSAAALRLAALGETAAVARLVPLHLQSFDVARYDAARVIGWLDAALALDPRSTYPLFSAARVYAETPDPASSRAMLEFIHRKFLEDPDRRWPWLAHAALLAKHRLGDLPLARRYAADLQRRVTASDVPLWVTQMEIFILEDMNEVDAAKVLLGGLLESGRIRDPAEVRFLRERLEALEARTR